jgi:hypothetical protein
MFVYIDFNKFKNKKCTKKTFIIISKTLHVKLLSEIISLEEHPGANSWKGDIYTNIEHKVRKKCKIGKRKDFLIDELNVCITHQHLRESEERFFKLVV